MIIDVVVCLDGMKGKETPIGHVEDHRSGIYSAPAAAVVVVIIVQEDATTASVVSKIPVDVSPFVFSHSTTKARMRGGGGVEGGGAKWGE
jgi:hypothetical protein